MLHDWQRQCKLNLIYDDLIIFISFFIPKQLTAIAFKILDTHVSH